MGPEGSEAVPERVGLPRLAQEGMQALPRLDETALRSCFLFLFCLFYISTLLIHNSASG